MKYSIHIFIILFAASFWSCRPKPLAIDIPILEPEVVVFSQIIPDDFMTVALTQTISALDFSEDEGDSLSQNFLNELLVSDATVTVGYKGIIDTLFEVTNGVYSSVQTPQHINEEYILNITTKEGKTLKARNMMLPLIEFMEVNPVIEITSTDTLVKVDYQLSDAPGDNWYMLNFYTNRAESSGGIDLNSFFGSGNNVLKKTELLSDAAFDGNVFEGTVELEDVQISDSLVVTISNINETYFQFLELRANSQNFFTELTKEPVGSPTNVEGGLGFFNTHYPDIHFFNLADF